MKGYSVTLLACILISTAVLTGCANQFHPRVKNPVTLTLWHNYGGQLKEAMDMLIDEFNETIGMERGVAISVTSISSSAALHEKLTMGAGEEPGAPPLPDIATAYPKKALILAEKGLLANLNEQFTPEELAAYLPEFLEEGRMKEGHMKEGHMKEGDLYVFPAAKSTEVLFVNTTIFDRFAEATGAGLDDLQTWKGIANTAALYYDWTDQQTPDVENDGKIFFMPDSLFNFAQIGYQQLGAEFISNGAINFAVPQFDRLWECYYKPAVLGHIAIFDGYATDLAKTGDIICSTGSTAGVSFFSPAVTYADNSSEPAELAILPYPVFKSGKKVALQRGGGMCVLKSTKEKEYLAGIFLKWFTNPANNLRFVSSTGYLPVTAGAFDEIMSREVDGITDERIKKLLRTAGFMQKEYTFYIPPLFEGIDELQKQYESKSKEIAAASRESYLNHLKNSNPDTAYEAVSGGMKEAFFLIFSVAEEVQNDEMVK